MNICEKEKKVPNNMENTPPLTLATGDQLSEPIVIRIVKFDRYEIGVELTLSGKFLNIVFIKIQKSFIKTMKQTSDVHDVEEYYSEE